MTLPTAERGRPGQASQGCLWLLQTFKVINVQPERNLVTFFSCFYYKHIILIGKTLNTSFTVIKSKHLSNIPKKILDKN